MANEAAAPQDIAQRWSSLSNADRSRLLQGMTPDEKKSLRDAIRRSKLQVCN
jgi:hypothetical protein